MTQPMTRTELYWRVDNVFHEMHPDAPQQLSATDPAHARWRTIWIEERDRELDEEVNRVYWARHPDAPYQLDDDSPEWEPWREAWRGIRREVMCNAPEPEDVQLQNAVSDDGVLDLSHIKAAVREQLIEQNRYPVVIADTLAAAIELADRLCEDVGAQAMAAGTIHGQWQSRTESVTGLGNERVELTVTGWWGIGQFTGLVSSTMQSMD